MPIGGLYSQPDYDVGVSIATRLFEARTRTPKTALRGRYGPFLAEALLMATKPRPSAKDYPAYIYAVSGLVG